MRDATLRWGLVLGLAGAALGVSALLIGAFFFPIPPSTTAEIVAVAILVRGVLALLALGVTLGLAYYAGLRVERDRLREAALLRAEQAGQAENESLSALPVAGSFAGFANERLGSLIAGLLVTFCWWFATAAIGYLLRLLPQTASSAADPSQFAQRLIEGALIVLIGAGLGALGGRTAAARSLLGRIIVPPPSTSPTIASPATNDAPPISSSVLQTDNSVIPAIPNTPAIPENPAISSPAASSSETD